MAARHLIPAWLLVLGAPLVAQTHAHSNPFEPGLEMLHFGVIQIPTSGTSTIRLQSGAGQLPVVQSGNAVILDTSMAHPTAFRIHIDENPALYPWRVYLGDAALGANGVRSYTLTPGVTCVLRAPNPFSGTYPQPVPMGYVTQPIYIGGTLTITSTALPGIYTHTIGSTTFSDTTNRFFTEDNYAGGVYVSGQGQGSAGGADYWSTFPIQVILKAATTPLSVTTTSTLHFGTLYSPTAAVSVRVYAANGSRAQLSGTNILTTLAPLHSRAQFNLTGNRNGRVDYFLPSSTVITNGSGATMTVRDFTRVIRRGTGTPGTEGAPAANVDYFNLSNPATGNGVATFWVGATLDVNANQPGGLYQGTYPITFVHR